QYTFFDPVKLPDSIRFINLSQVVLEKDLGAVLEEITRTGRVVWRKTKLKPSLGIRKLLSREMQSLSSILAWRTRTGVVVWRKTKLKPSFGGAKLLSREMQSLSSILAWRTRTGRVVWRKTMLR